MRTSDRARKARSVAEGRPRRAARELGDTPGAIPKEVVAPKAEKGGAEVRCHRRRMPGPRHRRRIDRHLVRPRRQVVDELARAALVVVQEPRYTGLAK